MSQVSQKLKQAETKFLNRASIRSSRSLIFSVIILALIVAFSGNAGVSNAAIPPVVAPVVTISANPASVVIGKNTTITWSAANSPASCTASGSWSGTRPASGSIITGTFNKVANFKYSLACSNSAGTGNASVSVVVTAVPPPTPEPATPTIVGAPYTCTGPVNNLFITGTGSSTVALINLKSGCTGNLSFDVTITSGGGDGVKVQAGAHDLNIGPSKIVCQPGVDPSAHQDGVQVQGGTNVTFRGLQIICPYVSGNGAGGFYVNGASFAGINNVICDGCNLEHSHGALTYNEDSVGHSPVPINSGASNSILHQNPIFQDYSHIYTINSLTLNAGFLDFNNTHVPDCDGSTASPC